MAPAVERIRRALTDHRRFLVCGHDDLDGDCMGSQLAIYHALVAAGKEAVVVCGGPTIERYSFLPGFGKIVPRLPGGFQAEVTICVDTASAQRVLPGVRLQGLVINIDHHLGNTNFGDINWVDASAAAVGEQVFELLEGDRRPPTPEIASCLYVALLTDTGAFRFANTTARTFEIAAALVRAGASAHKIAQAYYDNVHPDTVRMSGEVFSRLHFELDGRLVWGEITRDMYERLGGPERQPEQLPSQMRAIQGVEVAVLFHEDQADESSGRASLRSRGRIDVSAIAAELGGGGHVSAAGCKFEGDYSAGRDQLLEVTRRHLAALR